MFNIGKSRRGILKLLWAGAAGGSAAAVSASSAAAPQAGQSPSKRVHYRGEKPKTTPLFSGAVSYGNLLFIAGKGAHFEGDIKAHTNHVLDEIQKELENAGSSMAHVLKVQVYLAKRIF